MKEIVLSRHAQEKLSEKFAEKVKIDIHLIRQAILMPDFTEKDKNDAALMHCIKKFNDRYLRVIFRKEKESIKVVTFFYDRRIRRKLRG
jgi:hypothetical protein